MTQRNDLLGGFPARKILILVESGSIVFEMDESLSAGDIRVYDTGGFLGTKRAMCSLEGDQLTIRSATTGVQRTTVVAKNTGDAFADHGSYANTGVDYNARPPIFHPVPQTIRSQVRTGRRRTITIKMGPGEYQYALG